MKIPTNYYLNIVKNTSQLKFPHFNSTKKNLESNFLKNKLKNNIDSFEITEKEKFIKNDNVEKAEEFIENDNVEKEKEEQKGEKRIFYIDEQGNRMVKITTQNQTRHVKIGNVKDVIETVPTSFDGL